MNEALSQAIGDWVSVAPLMTVALGGFALLLVDAFTREKAELALVTAVILASGAAVSLGAAYSGSSVLAPASITRFIAVDLVAQFFNVAICLGGAFASLLAGGYLREHRIEHGEFYVLLVFSALGAMVLAASKDLLTLFVGLETMSLGVYCLVAFRRGSARAAEAGIKYFLLGSFAAAMLLFGSALLYGATGHTDFAGIADGVAHADAMMLPLAILGLVMVLVGLLFKVSAVPFHMWTPDAYEGAVTPATAFMSVVVKSAAFAVLTRLLVVGFSSRLAADPHTGWPAAVVGISVVTMIYGNVAAAYQSSVKRMLAYSSIAHAGYILVGVAAMSSAAVRAEAVSAVMYYLAAYTVSNILAFGSLIALGSYRKEAVSYEDLAGAGRRHPAIAVPFILGALSLMGFPPTAGFIGKWSIFEAALHSGDSLVVPVVIGVLTSVIGAYYYLRIVVYLFMRSPQPDAPVAVPMRSGYVAVALTISAVLVLAMGILPTRYLELALAAAKALV